MLLRDALLGILAALVVIGLSACAYERRWAIFFFALLVFSGLGGLIGYELRHTG
jgi:hypothetical protein